MTKAKMTLTFTDQYCIADPTLPGESTYGILAFPHIDQTADGLLVMAYHDGPDGPGGVTRLKTSSDRGVTWTPGTVVWAENLGTGSQITVLSNGDWLLVSQTYAGSPPTPAGVCTKRSTDGGASWQPTQFVTDTAFSGGHTYTSTAAYETAPGTLLWPVYGSGGGHNIAKALTSADGGATWTVGATIAAVPGVDVSEVTIQQLPDGTLAALVRCSDMAARRITSTDGGATWSAPVVVFSGCDSRIDWVRLASGRCVAAYRDAASRCALATYSDDDGLTWATPVLVHGPDKRTSYSSLVEVAPGQVFAAIGEIDGTATGAEVSGRIAARYLLTTPGVAPTGQDTYPDARRRAEHGDVVAYDTFNRADNPQGLGSADSGHQWFEFGGGADWQISGGIAVNTAARIHSTTIATGNAWGSVEADLQWTGPTSSPIGLCAKRSTDTGHALVGKVDSAGTIARISYFDGSSVTDKVVVTGLHITAGVWHRFVLSVDGDEVTLTIDGVVVATYPLTAADHSLVDAGTRWGIWGGGSSGVTYRARNLVVRRA